MTSSPLTHRFVNVFSSGRLKPIRKDIYLPEPLRTSAFSPLFSSFEWALFNHVQSLFNHEHQKLTLKPKFYPKTNSDFMLQKITNERWVGFSFFSVGQEATESSPWSVYLEVNSLTGWSLWSTAEQSAVSVARQEMKASKLCVNAACSLITVEYHMPTHHHSKCYLQPHHHSKYSLKPKARVYLAGLEILVLGTSTVGNGDRDSRTLGRGQNLIGARESSARLCSPVLTSPLICAFQW